MSEDVLASINVIKKLGIKVIKNNSCKIHGKGIDGFNYKNNLLNAQNSGTLADLF